jgi:hypothetical protein
MDNNLSGGYTSNDNTLSGLVDIYANSVTADTITGTDGYFTNLNAQNLYIVGGNGAFGIASWGSFWSLATQTNPTANTVNFMTFNNSDLSNNNVNLKSGSSSQIQVDLSGVYNIQFSAQTNITQGSNGTIYIWLRVNGVDIPATNGKENIGNANGQIIAWNYILSLNAGDYIQLAWASSDIHMQLLYEAASGSPTKPAIPSVILTVQAVSTNLKGDKGDTGTNGTTGQKGDKGDTGQPGTAATIAVNNTTTGAPGTQALVSNVGTSNAALLNFTIPQGQKGDGATITVNSTTTGGAGTSAVVTNVGTLTAALLDFTIPQGIQGNKGDKGEKGDNGDATAATAAAVAAAGSAAAAAVSASSASASAASSAASAASAAASASNLEPRVSVLETKTQAQTSYTDVNTKYNTTFQDFTRIRNTTGFDKIILDGNAQKITCGTSVIENDKITVGSGTTSLIEPTKITSTSLITTNIDNPSTDLNIGVNTLNVGQNINIGNPLTAGGAFQSNINLYGKINFGNNDVIGVVYQFLT